MKMRFPTPTALHPMAQGRAAVKPQSGPWVTGDPTRHKLSRGFTNNLKSDTPEKSGR